HIAQNQYRQGDSGLGVMPFFHTMGVRIMLSTALLNGRLVCVPEYGPSAADLQGAADDALPRAHNFPRPAATSRVRILRPAFSVPRRLRRHDDEPDADRALP